MPWSPSEGLEGNAVVGSLIFKPVRVKLLGVWKVVRVVVESNLNILLTLNLNHVTSDFFLHFSLGFELYYKIKNQVVGRTYYGDNNSGVLRYYKLGARHLPVLCAQPGGECEAPQPLALAHNLRRVQLTEIRTIIYLVKIFHASDFVLRELFPWLLAFKEFINVILELALNLLIHCDVV